MKRWRPQGFTLIEVLIALFVIALGIGALLTTLLSSADTVGHLRDKSLAEWVALNRISEVRLNGSRPKVGVTSGTVEQFAGGRWGWQQTVSDPGIAGILRIEVKVISRAASTTEQPRAEQLDDNFPALATAYGFIGTAVAPPTGIDPDWSLAAAGRSGTDGTGTGTGTGTGNDTGTGTGTGTGTSGGDTR